MRFLCCAAALAGALFLPAAAEARARRATAPETSASGTTEPRAERRAAAPARTPSAAQLAQRERMRTCNATARTQSLHGDPRRAFMRTCLSNRAATAPAPTGNGQN